MRINKYDKRSCKKERLTALGSARLEWGVGDATTASAPVNNKAEICAIIPYEVSVECREGVVCRCQNMTCENVLKYVG